MAKKREGNQKLQSQRTKGAGGGWDSSLLLTVSTSTCVPNYPQAMRVGAALNPLHSHLGCSDLCLGILPRLSSSHFHVSAEHPVQPLHGGAPLCSLQMPPLRAVDLPWHVGGCMPTCMFPK